MVGCLKHFLAKGTPHAVVILLSTYQVFWKEVALQRCRPEPWGPGCGDAPGPAGWLQSSLHCWPHEYEVPREQSASVVLEGEKREVNVRK